VGRSLVVCLVLLAAGLPAQTPRVITVGAADLPSHIQQRVPAAYPPLAVAARVEGTVTLTVLISPAGRVEDALPMRSIPLLDPAAIDAVRQWRFLPFLAGGQPVQALAEISIPFYIDQSTARLAQEVTDKADDCRALLAAARYAESEPVCAAMSSRAGKLPSLDRADAYHLAGQMHVARGRLVKAADAFTAEVRLTDQSYSDRMATACQSLGAVQASRGDLKNARRQYDKAEKAARAYQNSIQYMIGYLRPNPVIATVLEDRAATRLRSVLSEYIDVLRKAGLEQDAVAAQLRLDAVTPRSPGKEGR
jgi:TonB family protein